MTDKTTDITGATEAAAPTPRAHNAGGGGAAAGGSKRFSAKRKLAIVQRLLRGESLETVSRDENVAVHRLTEWREKVLGAAESALKERKRDAHPHDGTIVTAKVDEVWGADMTQTITTQQGAPTSWSSSIIAPGNSSPPTPPRVQADGRRWSRFDRA